MSIRILHTADLHLGAEYKSFKQKSSELQQESLEAFEKMVHYVIDPYNEINVLIIAGDLFDTPKVDLPLVEKVRDLLQKVTDKDILLYILPGNHDSYSYKNSVYRTIDFPGKVIKTSDFSLIDHVSVKGEPLFIYSGLYEVNNPHKRILKDFKIENQPGAHVGILHGSLELKEISIPDRELPFSYEEFAYSGLNYLALGHFHSYKEKQKDQEHKCVYSGSLVPRTIDEYGDKYSVVVEIKQNNTVSLEKLQFSKVRAEKRILDVIKEDIHSIQDLVDLLKRNKDIYLILDLCIKGVIDFSINEKDLQEILEDYYYYIRVTNETKYIQSSLIKQISQEETIRGLFFRKLIEKEEKMGKEKQKILNQGFNLGLRDFTQTGHYKDAEFSFQKGDHNIEID